MDLTSMSKFFKYGEIKAHQERVLQKLRKKPSMLLYHGTGSGKTLTSLLAAEDQDLDAVIIGPASLKHNYPKEQKKHKTNVKFTYYSYNKPPDPKEVTDKLLIFDEAHNMGRMESGRSHYPDIYQAKKELYLTATPIRNNPEELVPLIRGLGVKLPRDPVKFKKEFIKEIKHDPGFFAKYVMGVAPGVEYQAKNLSKLTKGLEGVIDYYKPDEEGYPSVLEEVYKVEMSPSQYHAYKSTMRGQPNLLYKIKRGIPPSKTESRALNAFLSASRQISNTPREFDLKAGAADEPKINMMADEIEKLVNTDKNYRGVSYSNYLASGVLPLSEKLTEKGISHAIFTGKISDKKKASIIKDYNEGNFKHLLISGAGSEGLDLKGTKLLQIMEPHWNEPKIEQVKGRVSRYKSHEHLPEDERKVLIQKYLAVPPKKGIIFKKRPGGADEYLTMLSTKKTALNEQFLKALRQL